MTFRKCILLLFVCATFVGCSDQTEPDGLLVQTYSDVLVARERHGDSATVKQKVDSILVFRNYDADEFQSDLRSMANTPVLMKAFYDSVMYELRRRRDTLR